MDVPQAHAQAFLASAPLCSRRVYNFVVNVEIGPMPVDPFANLFGLLEGGPSSSFLGLLSGSQVLVEPKLSALQTSASAQHRELVAYRCHRDDDCRYLVSDLVQSPRLHLPVHLLHLHTVSNFQPVEQLHLHQLHKLF
jgi:hypothetical protein